MHLELSLSGVEPRYFFINVIHALGILMSEPIAKSVRFDAAPDYHELNAGAHRNPPRVLTGPSLVWHLAVWTCDDPDEPKQDKSLPAAAAEESLQEAKGAAVKDSV